MRGLRMRGLRMRGLRMRGLRIKAEGGVEVSLEDEVVGPGDIVEGDFRHVGVALQ